MAVSPDDVAEYEELRQLVSRKQSLLLLDDFAKWLFAAAAVVGTLGASFGASDANALTGAGRKLFAVAVALVGVSLALAALARLPLGKKVNFSSRDSLKSHIDGVTQFRGRLLRGAALLFAFALVLAGFAPLFSR